MASVKMKCPCASGRNFLVVHELRHSPDNTRCSRRVGDEMRVERRVKLRVFDRIVVLPYVRGAQYNALWGLHVLW